MSRPNLTRPPKISTQSADVQRLDQVLRKPLEALTDKPHLDSWLLEDLDLAISVENWVEHKLGRPVRGYKVVKQDALSIIWQVEASTADLSLYLPLACDMAVTVDLVVF